MKTQLDFIRETRKLEREAADLEKAYLAYIIAELRKDADLTTADKYTLLTAFVDDFAGNGDEFAWIFDYAPNYVTARVLTNAYERLATGFGITEKRESIRARMQANNNAFAEWDRQNSPQSPLLPN